MDNHGFRYYDPEVGRYISLDPIGFDGGANWYAYVHNNPINHIDPLGLEETGPPPPPPPEPKPEPKPDPKPGPSPNASAQDSKERLRELQKRLRNEYGTDIKKWPVDEYQKWQALNEEAFAPENKAAQQLPADYCSLMRRTNGGEGFIGAEYVRLYRVEQLATLNKACGVHDFVPGILVIGSNGGGEAFAFDMKDENAPLVKMPFIPMTREYAAPCARTVTDFFTQLARDSCTHDEHEPNPSLLGKEIHEITPMVFGGDPVDQKNKRFLSVEEYAPFVLFWNRKWREARKCSGPPNQ